MRRTSRWIKRALDLLGALTALVFVLPIILVAGFLIRRASPGPMFFLQDRIGLRGRPFRIYKLRTMLILHDAEGRLLPDDQRINSVGRFLRASSIDELPQIFNVLKGDMSFIGPRPLPVEYRDRFSPEQFRRHEVLPGMGSLADIRFNRSVPDWNAIFECDVWYVDHASLAMDLKLFFQIAHMVLTRKGSGQGASGQMPVFRPGAAGARPAPGTDAGAREAVGP